jgi:hypothetical protein
VAFAAFLCAASPVVSPGRAQSPAAPAPVSAETAEELAAPAGQPAAAPGAALSYHFELPRPLGRFNDRQIELLEKLNRADRTQLGDLSEIVAPDRWDLPTLDYSPMPEFVARFAFDPKALIIDVPGQVFGAYENGRLIRWGPVNTGKRETATPSGFYHLNWKSRLRTSSVDRGWKMPYYFSVYVGIAIHEYRLPGKPASHGCIRMLHRDAKWLFQWGRGADFRDGKKVADGTPVLVVGEYDFGGPRPWLQSEWLARGVELHASVAGVESVHCCSNAR